MVYALVGVFGVLLCQVIPLALIRVIYLAFIVAFPLAVVLMVVFSLIPRLERFTRVVPALILFAPVGFVTTMLWADGDELCHKAARNGSMEWLDTVLQGGPDVVDTHGNSILMKAAQHGNTAMVKELLLRGARTGYRDGDGDTALSVAIRYKHPECVTLLRDAGARN